MRRNRECQLDGLGCEEQVGDVRRTIEGCEGVEKVSRVDDEMLGEKLRSPPAELEYCESGEKLKAMAAAKDWVVDVSFPLTSCHHTPKLTS